MSEEIRQIAERLVGLRDALNLRPEDIASTCNINLETYLGYESGEKDIPVSFLHQIAKHYGVEEGIVFEHPTIEFSYKNDALGDPLLNTYHALALKLATPEEIKTIEDYSFRINDALKTFWATCGVTLVDFKLEFGRLSDGTIVLADEISPDTSRLWDSKTHEKLDKDRFRRDLGGVEEAYAEIMRRLEEHLK